jgi:hypothetical protein
MNSDELLEMVREEMAKKPHYLVRIKNDHMRYEVWVGSPDANKTNLLIQSSIELHEIRIVKAKTDEIRGGPEYPWWFCIPEMKAGDPGKLLWVTPLHKDTICGSGFPDVMIGKILKNILAERGVVFRWDKSQQDFVPEAQGEPEKALPIYEQEIF